MKGSNILIFLKPSELVMFMNDPWSEKIFPEGEI